MTEKLPTCLPCSRRAGVSLIEVIAAIAIMGTILAGVVMSKARHTRQIALTQRTQQAVLATDQLITNWWASKEGVPVGTSGTISDGLLAWETYTIPDRKMQALSARVVRVSVYENVVDEQAAVTLDALVTVDLVLPDPEATKERKSSSTAERSTTSESGGAE